MAKITLEQLVANRDKYTPAQWTNIYQSLSKPNQRWVTQAIAEEEARQQKEDIEKANDPLQQMIPVATGGVVGGVARPLGEGIYDAIPSLNGIANMFSGGSTPTVSSEAAQLADVGSTALQGGLDTSGLSGAVSSSPSMEGSLSSALWGGGDAAAGGAQAGTGLLGSAGPAIAAIISGIGQGRGVYEGYQDYQMGHGRQQQGLEQIGNSVFSPVTGFNDMLGQPVDSDTLNTVLGFLNPITMPFAAADALGINFWSGKDKDQQSRDWARERMQQMGLMDDKYQIDLGDNTQFDLGLDGSEMLQNKGTNIDDKTERHYYDVDFSDPNAERYVQALDPIAAQIAGDNDKLKSDVTGMLYNRITASSDPDKALASLLDKFKTDTKSSTAKTTNAKGLLGLGTLQENSLLDRQKAARKRRGLFALGGMTDPYAQSY